MKKIFLWIWAATALLASCTKEPAESTGPVNKDFTIRYSVPASTVVKSYIAAEDGEDNINSLTLLFFEKDDAKAGQCVAYYKVPDLSGMSSGYVRLTDLYYHVTGGPLYEDQEYVVFAVANIEPYMEVSLDEILSLVIGMTELDIMEALQISVEGSPDNTQDSPNRINPTEIPMSAKTILKAEQRNLEIALTRIVSRFDVIFAVQNHRLYSVSIWNAFKYASVFDYTFNDFSISRTQKFYSMNEDEITYGYPNFPNGYIRGGLYAFENYVMGPTSQDYRTTCLIVGIQKEIFDTKGAPANYNAPRYFRVNINSKDFGQSLIRNHVYSILITDVDYSRGENNERNAAYGRPVSRINYEITGIENTY